MILAGDIGGTNTRLALYDGLRPGARPARRARYRNDEHDGVAAIVGAFLGDGPRPEVAGLAVAGVVADGICRLTNRDWMVSAAGIGAAIGAPVVLANDVAAAAIGVVHLEDAGFAVLQPGDRPWAGGNVCVVAPGTGLGQAATLYRDGRHWPLASEAGHADFAPVVGIELELAAFLASRHGGHASVERVLSGPGIADIADFLVESGRFAAVASVSALPQAQRPAELTRLGLAGSAPLAVATLELFAGALAREAGNAALRYLALGGVALAGGIPPRLLGLLNRPEFLTDFADKGRFCELLRSLPLRVATNPDATLLGAAHIAAAP